MYTTIERRRRREMVRNSSKTSKSVELRELYPVCKGYSSDCKIAITHPMKE